jgi:hypothetical protein
MKTTFKLLGIALIAIGFSSCESIKSLADVEFETELTADLDVTPDQPVLKSGLETWTFFAEEKIDPTSDPDINQYADNIKGYNVSELKAIIKSTTKTGVTIASGSFFEISGGSDNARWTLPSDFDVTVGNSYVLGNTAGEWDTVQRILGRNSEFSVSVDGEISDSDVTVVIEIYIKTKVTANPL